MEWQRSHLIAKGLGEKEKTHLQIPETDRELIQESLTKQLDVSSASRSLGLRESSRPADRHQGTRPLHARPSQATKVVKGRIKGQRRHAD